MEEGSLRRYAGVFDIRIMTEDKGTHNMHPSPDAIGGYYSMGWHESYQDAINGEVYRVHCWDGVNSGKSAHADEDLEWMALIERHIVDRTHRLADSGANEIRISRNERIVMQHFIHVVWLESAAGSRDGQQSTNGLDGGLVGHCHGVPVICDPGQADDLPARPTMDRVVYKSGSDRAINSLAEKLASAAS